MKFTLFFVLNFLAVIAVADIDLTAINGYSAQQGFRINNNASLVILGGFAGDATACNNQSDKTSTCNNCSETDPSSMSTVCNKTRAYDSLNLTFTFSSTEIDNTNGGTPRLTTIGDGNVEVLVESGLVSGIKQNQAVTLTTTWAKVCAALNEDPAPNTCEGLLNKTQTFKIGLDAASDGFVGTGDDFLTFSITVHAPTFATTDTNCANGGLCNFSLFPGDEKAFIENVTLRPAARPIRRVHFYCLSETQGTFNDIVASNLCASVDVVNNGLTKESIDGLINGELFAFRVSSEDDAGNIGLFLSDNTTCPPGVTALPGLTSCRQVRPDQVGGLFKDNCFIATAAYGSIMEPQVKILRSFRDQYLQPNFLGKIFIKAYYKMSPPMARWIAASETRRSIARFFLTPVIFTVKTFMAAPILTSLILCGVFLTLLSLVGRRRLFPRFQKGSF